MPSGERILLIPLDASSDAPKRKLYQKQVLISSPYRTKVLLRCL